MPIFYLSEQGSMLICGFNMKNGVLWVTKMDGYGCKIAEGEKAEEVHEVFLKLAMSQYPCVIENKGNFATNVNLGAE